MKRRIGALLTGLALAAALILPAGASTPSALWVDGRNVWEEARAQMVNGTTYVSLRTVAGILAPDATVSWTGTAARVGGAGVALSAVPGARYITVNDRALYVPDGVRAENGCVLVPIRVLAAALGGTVDWSPAAGVTLTRGSGRPGAAPYSGDDLYWLSRIISAESRGEPLAGKLAVGTVVLNRVASSEFPDTIYGVIFDDQWGVQFTPTANGAIYDEPTAESVLAAKLCLEGAQEAGNSLYFFAPNLASSRWIMDSREYVTTIGNHRFYR